MNPVIIIKFSMSVLCYFGWVLKVSTAPIIKPLGIQWTEEKGTGKGNITLIMIPETAMNSNDSDMIVAVKSDFQVLSQDSQLLNLVVNERQNSVRNNFTSQIDESEPNVFWTTKDVIQLQATDGYFNTLTPTGGSINIYELSMSDPNKDKIQSDENKNGLPINIHELSVSDPNKDKIQSDENKNGLPINIHELSVSDPNKDKIQSDENKNGLPINIHELSVSDPNKDKIQSDENKNGLPINIHELSVSDPNKDKIQSDENKNGLPINIHELSVSDPNKDKIQSDENKNGLPINIHELSVSDPNKDKIQSDENKNGLPINIHELSVSDPNKDKIQSDENKNGLPHSNINIPSKLSGSDHEDDKNIPDIAEELYNIETQHESTNNVIEFLNNINQINRNGNIQSDKSNDTPNDRKICVNKMLNSPDLKHESKLSNERKYLEEVNTRAKISNKMQPKDSFFNQAVKIIDYLKEVPYYYRNGSENNGNLSSNSGYNENRIILGVPDNKFTGLKHSDLELVRDENEVKEFQYPSFNKHSFKSNIAENSKDGYNTLSTIQTCETFFIVDSDNQTQPPMEITSSEFGENDDKIVLTLHKSSDTEAEKKKVPSTAYSLSDYDKTLRANKNQLDLLTNEISQTTVMELGTSVGTSIGTSIGTSVGTTIGTSVGTSIGTSVGTTIGTSIGTSVGTTIGTSIEAVQTSLADVTTVPVTFNLSSSTTWPSIYISSKEPENSQYHSTVSISEEVTNDIVSKDNSSPQSTTPSAEMCTKIIVVQCNPDNPSSVYEKSTMHQIDIPNGANNGPKMAKQVIPKKITLEPNMQCDEIVRKLKLNTHTSSNITKENGSSSIPIVENALSIKDVKKMLKIPFFGKSFISKQKFTANLVPEKNCEPTPEIESDSDIDPTDEDLETESESSEVTLEVSPKFPPIKPTTQKTVNLSTKLAANKNAESRNLITDGTTRNESPIVLNQKNCIHTKTNVPATITTHKSILPKEYESNRSGSLHTENNVPGKNSTKNCEKRPKEKTIPTEIPNRLNWKSDILSQTTVDQNFKHKPNEKCEKNIHLPNNSVNEIIIQIEKNTRKPRKQTSCSKPRLSAGRDMQNYIWY